ncbi:hypothetical protein BDV38DRAFT_267549 [Aspergillus pseudotamarii]|uniref:Uncharacterized protein n=1 Tax=Aspergillus pseudotamarii TaxID=132259 RepID=A0A5N6T9Q3_ASPPS|nr:uncharacterized protein BDV38DRAFT_267549 [Aspergillus pseudotamarii]KAE8142909.1 hypothetical protein BDV38DRAFT_267549 [Aspergillus pseudotamarii]
MPDPTMPEEYAELMKHNGHEHYLYTPQRYSKLHPGSVGFFDKYGFWNQITDLSQPGYPDDFSFKDIGKVLSYDEPTEYMWDAVSSGNEAGSSFGLNGGLSGMLAAAPVDAEANASNKRGSSGTAALITTQSVKNQRLEGGSSRLISDWVKKNGKMLMKSNYGDDIRGYGLWVIHTTWSTECAIKMNSAFHRNTSAGLDLGATDVGKVGGSGSSLKKLESNGWKSYQATESDQGLVVAYGGARYRLHSIRPFWINPLKQAERVSDPPARHFEYNEKQETIGISIGVMVRGANGDNHWVPSSKEEFIFDENRKLVGKVYWNRISDEYGREISWVPYHRENYIFDEDGEKTGAAYFRPTRGSTREQIEWEQYDKDAEEIDAKKKETEMANQARREYEDQDEFEIECETVGMDDNEYDTKAVERTETTPLMSKCCVM